MQKDRFFKNKQCLITYQLGSSYCEACNYTAFAYQEDLNFAYIEFIETHKDFRSSGIGRETLQKFIEKMKSEGVKAIYLMAVFDPYDYNSNTKYNISTLVNFYKSFGFESISEDINNEEDIVEMRLKL